MSAVGGPSWRIIIMLKNRCGSPPCSQPALSTVHQRPIANTGTAPDSPKTRSARLLGPNSEKIDCIRMGSPSSTVISSVAT